MDLLMHVRGTGCYADAQKRFVIYPIRISIWGEDERPLESGIQTPPQRLPPGCSFDRSLA